MKKKKSTNIEATLAKAEKFLRCGNFALALKTFETVQKELNRDDIADKITRCRQEVKIGQAKQLVKKACRAVKKGTLDSALTSFQRANAVLNEPWVTQQIEAIEGKLTRRDAFSSARSAETAGDFEKAAKCYAAVCEPDDPSRESMLIKSARCFVKAGRYAEALNIFKDVSLAGSGARYDYGFALVQSGFLAQGLRAWDEVDVQDSRFTEQKHLVARQLAADLVDRLNRKADLASIHDDVSFLMHKADSFFGQSRRDEIKTIHEHAVFAWIEELWEKEDFHTIEKILGTSALPLTPDLLALKAKVGFKTAGANGRHLHTMLLYWLPAIYSPLIATSFGDNAGKRQQVRRKLIAMAESLIKKAKGKQNGRRVLTELTIDTELIQTIREIMEHQRSRTDFIFTPRLAALLDRSEEFLSLIRENESFFQDKHRYLETGAFYSAAGRYLYHLKNHDYEKAVCLFTDLPQDRKKDAFIDYAFNLISFEYGCHCLDNEDVQAGRFFLSAPALFDVAPALEEKLIQKALDFEEWPSLKPFEDVLSAIYRQRPSKVLEKALSLVMTRRAISMYNERKLAPKALNGIINRALKLDPENEMAREASESGEINQEIKAVCDAFDRMKLGKASRIARESEYDEVRDQYFQFIEDALDQIGRCGWEEQEKMMLINDLYQWGTSVDADQPIMTKLEMHLNMN
ncbi:tetratricopeptide repeat protein [Desulfosarcina ovata]|uniref:Tetratricopeptide repeat protein n=1 Tax=Desulfosarcina ovata subsp. ovata TaxID=2752305 RepID=A0A5K8AJ42_9BACT|nr:hypothetical protein [Desulfosarcina ovata]BBO92713.1 hypothetical protein DSCOOX_58930 [Desulfosarcina ovata subsp. ovata]